MVKVILELVMMWTEDLWSIDALMERLLQMRSLIHAKAKVNVASAQDNQKKQYEA